MIWSRATAAPPDVGAVLLQVREELAPFFDAADGMRRDMEARGWSPAMAEAVAGQWLAASITGGRR